MNTKPIKYYSTNLKAPEVSFEEALLGGLAPDGGLYLPSTIPALTASELKSFSGKEYHEIAFEILNKFLGNEIEADILSGICSEVYSFDIPIEKVYDRRYILRLDHGPTASFKDFAARMMSRLMQYYLSVNNRHLTILTATSGDTGSAVASAFSGLKNINVLILYPANEVTAMQRKQMTTLGDNISVIAIEGKFDDCQRLVKRAFQDPVLSHIPLSSANSINIGRLLPQSVYYFYAFSKLASIDEQVIFSVPSGNFGNLMGGILASRMGLPVRKFIIATNENNEVPEFLKNGIYKLIDPSINCISSAMNVGHPSNLARIVALYGGQMNESGTIIKMPDLEKMRGDFYAVSVSDEETRSTIKEVYRKYKILLEPHGAVAWKGIKDYSEFNYSQLKPLYISLETAHPSKFDIELEAILGFNTPLPQSLIGLKQKQENYFSLKNRYELIKDFILMHYK
ncbi:MAG TPA: threonine synthase [Bacteroidales bacterium]|nr:threonine synthase [Bacteroidales bacterium]